MSTIDEIRKQAFVGKLGNEMKNLVEEMMPFLDLAIKKHLMHLSEREGGIDLRMYAPALGNALVTLYRQTTDTFLSAVINKTQGDGASTRAILDVYCGYRVLQKTAQIHIDLLASVPELKEIMKKERGFMWDHTTETFKEESHERGSGVQEAQNPS